MLVLILEAAFRSLLMAVTVWAGLRLLRLHHVLAQKLAWVLVLLAAVTMPLVMRAPFLPRKAPVSIPVRKPSLASLLAVPKMLLDKTHPAHSDSTATQSVEVAATSGADATSAMHVEALVSKPKPSAAHHADDFANSDELSGQVREVKIVAPMPGGYTATITAPVHAQNAAAWRPHITWRQIGLWAGIAYLSIAGLFLLRTIVGLAFAMRLWLRAVPLPGVTEGESALRVRLSPDLATPVTIGSSILLPANHHTWDEAKLRVVLAHEGSHVRQGDFYLQLFAALHAAVFWFSPLGWWLQRTLSDLGEALSDRAGLEQASDPASYAEILLDFAATPHPTYAGVAMARSNNLSSRIERILNKNRFRRAFLGGQRHAAIAAVLASAALLAAVALIRIVPAVEAAQLHGSSSVTRLAAAIVDDNAVAGASDVDANAGEQNEGQATGQLSGQAAPQSDQVTSIDSATAQDAPPAPVPPAAAPVAPTAPRDVPEPPEPVAVQAPVAPAPPARVDRGRGFAYINNDGDDSFAIINGPDNSVHTTGNAEKELQKARKLYHDHFIWVEHDGKNYVITDPAILAQTQGLYQHDEASEQLQAALNLKQEALNKQMEEFNNDAFKAKFDSPEMKREMAQLNAEIAKIHIDSPEMKQRLANLDAEIAKAQLTSPEMQKEMAELNDKLAELQSDKFKKMTEDLNKHLNQEALDELQERLGELQGQIGEIQGRIGEKQGELGEKMGRIGEEMGRLGEEQGRRAEEAARKMQMIIDKAIQDGKAKPIE